MKLLPVAVVYPGGNVTAVVRGVVPKRGRKALNTRLMQQWKLQNPNQPEIEQCCFIAPSKDPAAIARVEMFGGEFCGNATRSVVWLVTKGQDSRGLIEVSGADRPLQFSVLAGEVTVEMPLPSGGSLVTQVDEGFLVQLEGIAQLVVTQPAQGQTPRQLLDKLLQSNKYGLYGQPCVGVSHYDQRSSKAEFCVWVKEVETIFDETACGSGTCAIGVMAASKAQKTLKLEVVQPSGEVISTQANYQGGVVSKSFIMGPVSVLSDGEFSSH